MPSIGSIFKAVRPLALLALWKRPSPLLERAEYLFELPAKLDAWLKAQLNDERDIVLLRLLANVSLTTVPAAILLFCLPLVPPLLGLLYVVANFVLYLQRCAPRPPHASLTR